MLETDQLLQPISGANPCGIDLDYDSRFVDIKDLIEAGSEENPTQWKKVKKLCLELLNDGRSTELLVYLTVASVATEGFQGLRDGLIVLSKSIEEYWETIFPELDMEDDESERFTMRLNSIAQLGEPLRKMGDKLGFVELLLRAPLLSAQTRSAPGYWSVWASDLGDSVDSSEVAAVHDHISRMSDEERSALNQLLDESLEAMRSLGAFLMERTGLAYNAPFDEHLLPVVEKIRRVLDSDSGGSGDVGEASVGEPGGESVVNEGNTAAALRPVAVAAPPGTIESPADAKKALDKIIAYYKKAEPSSPVPFLLMRAQKLIGADFIEIVQNLNKDSEYQFRTTLDITEND